MKLGVSFIGYNIAEWFNEVIKPWQDVKNGAIPGVQLTSAVSLGVFPETHALGYPIHSSDDSEALIQECGLFDKIYINEAPIYEKDQRNLTLEYLLAQDIDLQILVDFDEIWTVDQIKKTLNFVAANEFIDWFRVEYKNYILYKGQKCYYYGFNPPRIWNNRRRGGIDKYYYDNDIQWRDGIQQTQASCITIPKSLVCVDHYSWYSKSVEYLHRKVQFQIGHYSHCSFSQHFLGVELNEDYYKKYNILPPELYQE